MLSESLSHTFTPTNVLFDSIVSGKKLWQQLDNSLEDAARYSDYPFERITKNNISLE
jgi:hypothetical protein